MDLNKLLKPRKMAVVGASEKPSTMGGDLLHNIKLWGRMEDVYMVNPKYDTIFGEKCYHSISDIPEDIDTVVICTSKKAVPGLLREAASKGCKGAVVYASGYGETRDEEGKRAQAELTALCHELDMALMGPNCGGFNNYIDRVCSFVFIIEDRNFRGNIGFVSQSGQLCQSLMENTTRFSYMMSVGNCSTVYVEDYMDFLVDDPDTKVVAVYVEGIKDPSKFISTLQKAARKRKPVVILKVGASEKASALASSHTGSMAGADKAFDAIAKKFGVIRVKDLEELHAISTVLSTLPELPAKPTFSAMAFSGGEGVVCADSAFYNGINFPDFESETRDALQAMLPYYATANNPLDMTFTMSYDSDVFAKALRTVMDDPNIGMCLLCFTILQKNIAPDVITMIEGIEKVARQGKAKPMAFVPLMENTRERALAERLAAVGVPILPPTHYAFSTLRHLADFIQYNADEKDLDLPVATKGQTVGAGTPVALTERVSKEKLGKYGMPVTREVLVPCEAGGAKAAAAAESLGFPVVMKIESEQIMHKSDVGGVVLNVRDSGEAAAAFDRILENVRINAPEACLNGVLIQEMAPAGLEIIIGVNNDPQFGPVVLCGLGGIFVEIFKDIALCPAPVSRSEAMNMLKSLKGYPLLKGARGGKKLDMEAVVTAIMSVSRYATEHMDKVSQIDINPLLVYPEGQGAKAVDALIINKT